MCKDGLTFVKQFIGDVTCRVIPALKPIGFKTKRTHKLTITTYLKHDHTTWHIDVLVAEIVNGAFSLTCEPHQMRDLTSIVFEKVQHLMLAHFQATEGATAKDWHFNGIWNTALNMYNTSD